MELSQGNVSMSSTNDDSMSSMTKQQTSTRKLGSNAAAAAAAAAGVVKVEENHRDRKSFYNDLYQFHDNKGYSSINKCVQYAKHNLKLCCD